MIATVYTLSAMIATVYTLSAMIATVYTLRAYDDWTLQPIADVSPGKSLLTPFIQSKLEEGRSKIL